MSNAEFNPPDAKAWPVEVLLGWVHDLGAYQMGFSLTPAWLPPMARRTDNDDYLGLLPHMHFPEKLTSWLLEQFLLRKISAISVVRFENRWRVHIGLLLNPAMISQLFQFIDGLTTAANLPLGSEGERIAEMERIGRDNPEYSETDIHYHLLGDLVKRAVQKMFDDARGD